MVTAEAVVVAGKKWAADGESMSADGELEVDDAMLCLAAAVPVSFPTQLD